MTVIQLLTLSLLLSTCLSARTKLRFFAANQPGGIAKWKGGRVVKTTDFTVCPKRLPTQFTLVCSPASPSTANAAEFRVDGVSVRTERVQPYTIAGDVDGIASPWNPPSTTVFVECLIDNGEKVSATIRFACDGVDVDPSLPTAPPPTRPRPVEVTAPRQPTPARPAPRPGFDLGSGSVGSGSSPSIVANRDCVKIPAMAFKSADTGSGKWEQRGQALFYKPRDNNRGIIPGGRVSATYKFTAPASSRFGFTLDMETNGGVDHNDVWVFFEQGGFTLTRGGKFKTSTGWTKAYHNRNGRSKQVFSVDFNPHTFSTRNVLVKGKEYTVQVGGRSTKTGFYSIIMFPCSGSQCDGTRTDNKYWQNSRDKCGKSRR